MKRCWLHHRPLYSYSWEKWLRMHVLLFFAYIYSLLRVCFSSIILVFLFILYVSYLSASLATMLHSRKWKSRRLICINQCIVCLLITITIIMKLFNYYMNDCERWALKISTQWFLFSSHFICYIHFREGPNFLLLCLVLHTVCVCVDTFIVLQKCNSSISIQCK